MFGSRKSDIRQALKVLQHFQSSYRAVVKFDERQDVFRFIYRERTLEKPAQEVLQVYYSNQETGEWANRLLLEGIRNVFVSECQSYAASTLKTMPGCEVDAVDEKEIRIHLYGFPFYIEIPVDFTFYPLEKPSVQSLFEQQAKKLYDESMSTLTSELGYLIRETFRTLCEQRNVNCVVPLNDPQTIVLYLHGVPTFLKVDELVKQLITRFSINEVTAPSYAEKLVLEYIEQE